MCVYEKVGLSRASTATALSAVISGRTFETIARPVHASESKSGDAESSAVDALASVEARLQTVLATVPHTRTDLFRAVVPASVYDAAFADNVQFQQDLYVYAPEFFQFMKNVLTSVEVCVCVCVCV
jgi:hypothetical protein